MKAFKKVISILILFTVWTGSNAQGLFQTIKGQVVDKETQISLPGATIVIMGTDPILGTTTDINGYFRISKVPVGRYTVSVGFIGYETVQIHELLVSTGKEVNLHIEMKESVEKINEVVVTANSKKDETINSMATLSARTFSIEEAGRYAGGFDDPARMASSFAGVTTGELQDNSIVIRGNAPKGILWMLEGVPVPNPNHFAGAFSAGGGFVTIFSSQMVSNSDFFTGAFPAEYGNALAGAFDIKLRTGNNEKREYWAQAGILGFDFGSEGPFVKGKKSSYLFNYRYSTYGLMSSLLPKGSGLPKYQDLSFKFNFPAKKAGVFTLWGVGAIDNMLKYEEKDSSKWETIGNAEREETYMKPAAAGISNKSIISSKSYMHTTIAATNYSGGHKRERLDQDFVLQDKAFIDMNEQKVIVNSFINNKFSPKHVNRTGFYYTKMFYQIDLREADTLGLPMIQFADSRGNSDLLQFYTQSKYSFSKALSLNIGFHTQYFFLNNNYTFEPRLGLKYDINPLHSLSLAIGKHSQLEDLKIYLAKRGNTLPNKNLDFTNAIHFVLGYDWKINETVRLKVEPYYQYLYNVPVIEDSSYSQINFHQQWFFNDVLVNKGTGRNIGIDVTFEKFLEKGYYWLFTASVFDSEYTGGDGITRKSAYDRGFVSNLLFGKEFYLNKNKTKQKIFGLNGKITCMGGERLTPILENESLAAKDIVYDYEHVYEKVADPTVMVNLGISYRTNKSRYSGVWSLQVINLLKSSSSHNYYYNVKENKIEVFNENVMIPNLSYKIEF